MWIYFSSSKQKNKMGGGKKTSAVPVLAYNIFLPQHKIPNKWFVYKEKKNRNLHLENF